MANVFVSKDRHVVPNFRRFGDTVALGELDSAEDAAPDPVQIDFQSRIAEWSLEPSVGLAGDIVSAALVSGDASHPQILDAASFVLDHEDVSSRSLVTAAQTILKRQRPTKERTDLLPRLTTFLAEHNRHKIYRRIRSLKAATARFGADPVSLTELARLYLIVGHEEKAKKSIGIALALAPHNRFVLRSAARLLAHCDDAERAYDLLSRNVRTSGDPWLVSAQLAMAGLVGKTARAIKPAARLLTSGDFSPLSLTELRAGLGSAELLDGDRRRSKRLLQACLEKPNDNTLAQVEWALSRDRLFDFNPGAFEVSRNFEALALEAFNQERWLDVIRHCESWLMDMPFASRPVMMASHVATVVLDDFNAAQLFCQAGLMATPNDPLLVNNYAYALALDGEPDEALNVLDGLPLSTVDDHNAKVWLTATRGLAYFRAGRILEGRLKYAEAMEAAQRIGDPSASHLAILNYVREELIADQPIPESILARARDLKVGKRAVTTQILKNKVIALIDAKSHTPSTP